MRRWTETFIKTFREFFKTEKKRTEITFNAMEKTKGANTVQKSKKKLNSLDCERKTFKTLSENSWLAGWLVE